MTFVTALAVAWFITAAVIVAVYLHRYARDWAEDRAREERYAREWAATHREHQDRGRYLTSDDRRPE